MQKQTVHDFVTAQAAAIFGSNPNGSTPAETDLMMADDELRQALFDRIEQRYGVCLSDAVGSREIRLDELKGLVVAEIKDRSRRDVDAKTVFENFVFSARCKQLSSPFELNIDLTFRCNYKCVFCYASAVECEDEKKKELSTDEVFDIIDEFTGLNGAFVLFGGGEPFVRDDFLEIYNYTKSKGLWTYIITNGSMITEEIAERYAKVFDPRYDKIQVSLDGSCAEVHDKQRGIDGAFDLTLRGIRNLTANGIRPLINTVATRLNIDDVPNILNLAIRENALTYRCLMLHKIGRGGREKLYQRLELSQEQNEWLYGFLERKRDELMGVIGIASDNACVFPMSTAAIREQIAPVPGALPNSYSCAAGTTKLAISPEGGVVPCSYFYDFDNFYVASLRERSLKDIWEDQRLWKDFRDPLQPEGKCRDCDYLYTCKTGCRIMSYVASGAFGGPDIGCTFNPSVEARVSDPSAGEPDHE